MNFTPKAVLPLELVASRPRARFVLAAGLFVSPKLMTPPVLWSPALAPACAVPPLRPYQPASVPERPNPPGRAPQGLAGKAKSNGLDNT